MGDNSEAQNRNPTPAVGILANEMFDDRRILYVEGDLASCLEPFVSESERFSYGSWLGDANVKFLEMGGAQVVPISPYQSDSFYKYVFDNTNGLYIPGNIFSDEVTRITNLFMEWSRESSADGNVFPIWGPFFSLTKFWPKVLSKNPMLSSPALITKGPDWEESKFVQFLSEEMREQIQKEHCTQGDSSELKRVTEEVFYQSGLGTMFKYVAGMIGENNEKYVSMLENDELGWYQLNFQPEKPSNVQDPSAEVICSELSIRFSFECAMFFVDQTRRNSHRLDDLSLLIYKEKKIHTRFPHYIRENSLVRIVVPYDQWYSAVYILPKTLKYTKDTYIFE